MAEEKKYTETDVTGIIQDITFRYDCVMALTYAIDKCESMGGSPQEFIAPLKTLKENFNRGAILMLPKAPKKEAENEPKPQGDQKTPDE